MVIDLRPVYESLRDSTSLSHCSYVHIKYVYGNIVHDVFLQISLFFHFPAGIHARTLRTILFRTKTCWRDRIMSGIAINILSLLDRMNCAKEYQ